MAPHDAMMEDDETVRFAQEIMDCIIRHGKTTPAHARELFDQSVIPDGLKVAPDYYLHESPYYWATYILTGNRSAGQSPNPDRVEETASTRSASLLTWQEVQQMIRSTALPVRSINWKGSAACPETAWIITTLDGPGNKLARPDQLLEGHFLLSAENVDEATQRMLNSKCMFPLHIFKRIPGKPVRYQHLGLGTVVGYDSSPTYPHWRIQLRPDDLADRRQLG